MTGKTSERCALAALITLVIYCLACMYPAAWSPDSKRLIFPVAGEDGVQRLVMTDLDCKVIREVASITGKENIVSPAAWSLDGKFVAYLRREVKEDKDGEKKATASAMIQEAETGKERCIFTMEGPTDDRDTGVNFVFGPTWLADSKAIAIRKASEGKAAVVLLDLDGKVKKEVPIPSANDKDDRMSADTFVVSPNGEYVAYTRWGAEPEAGAETRKANLVVMNAATGREESSTALTIPKDARHCPWQARPAWASDSRSIFAVSQTVPVKTGLVVQVDVQTGKPKVVWQRPKASAHGISVSADSPRLAVTYVRELNDTHWLIDVVDLGTGKATTVHFSASRKGVPFVGTAISPDGKWVAFCPSADKDDKPICAIVSSDGEQLRFYNPDPKRADAVPKIVENRLKAALIASGAPERLGLDKAQPDANPAQVMAEIDKLIAAEQHPPFREALAYQKVAFHLTRLEIIPVADRAAQADAAKKELNAFIKAYPGHVLGPALKKRLDDLLAGKDRVEEPKEPDANVEPIH